MTPLNINAAIGMNVFGYRVSWEPRFPGDQTIHPYTECPPYYLNAAEKALHSGRWFLPNWTQDLDKALQVVEMMNLRNFNFELKHEPWGHWVAGFGHTLCDLAYGDSDLPSMAICGAALAVFGIEIEENRAYVQGMRRAMKKLNGGGNR